MHVIIIIKFRLDILIWENVPVIKNRWGLALNLLESWSSSCFQILSKNIPILIKMNISTFFNPDLTWSKQLAGLLGSEEVEKLDRKLKSLKVEGGSNEQTVLDLKDSPFKCVNPQKPAVLCWLSYTEILTLSIVDIIPYHSILYASIDPLCISILLWLTFVFAQYSVANI